MNGAHLHLLVNHLPVFSIPVALLFLLYAVIVKNEGTQRFSLKVLLFCLLTTGAAFLTGEPAEHIVKGLDAIDTQAIHPHEEASEVAFYLSLAAAALTLFILIPVKKSAKTTGVLIQVLIALSFFISGYLGYVSFLGGKIHHPEFQITPMVENSQP